MAEFADILRISLTIRAEDIPTLQEMVTPKTGAELINRIDRLLFGAKGSFLKSIKEGGRAGAPWKPLSPEYIAWKRQARTSGLVLKGEAAPNMVISDKVWIRTGKMLIFAATSGSSGTKKVRMYPERILGGGGPFYEVYVDDSKIPYWVYPNESRQLFKFTDEDQQAAQAVFTEWIQGLMTEALAKAGLA